VSGNNLEMHGLFGFVESSVANFPCRFCKMSKLNFQTKFMEEESCIRCRESHLIYVQKSVADSGVISNSGVVSDSILNKLIIFMLQIILLLT
jgi:hypothetical protein